MVASFYMRVTDYCMLKLISYNLIKIGVCVYC